MTNHYCVLPFIHYEIKANGHVAPCCVSKMEYKDDNGVPLNIANTSIDDILNSKSAQKLKQSLLDNLPGEGCQQCYKEDKIQGATSRRVRENRRFKENVNQTDTNFVHRYVDLKLGNTCNNACMICSPNLSSKWAEQFNQAGLVWNRNGNNNNFKWYENQDYWDSLFDNIDQIKHIDLYGGEPFLIKQQWNLLQRVVDNGYAKNIILNYATNGTIYPKHAIENLWPEFKRVDILFSTDGIKDVHEYTRWPSKWDTFETNLKLFCEQGYYPNISYGVSNYSVWDIPRSLEYFYNEYDQKVNVWFNNVYNNGSDVAFLPQALKRQLVDKLQREWSNDWETIMFEKTFQSLIETIDSTAITDRNISSLHAGWSKFDNHVKTFDNVRDVSIIDIVPQYKNYLISEGKIKQ